MQNNNEIKYKLQIGFKYITINNVRKLVSQTEIEINNNLRSKLCREEIIFAYECGHRDFSNLDLSKLDLSMVNLSGADLYKTYLYNTNLYKANLFNTNISKADLRMTNLCETELSWVKAHKTNLYRATMSGDSADGFILSYILNNYNKDNYPTIDEVIKTLGIIYEKTN